MTDKIDDLKKLFKEIGNINQRIDEIQSLSGLSDADFVAILSFGIQKRVATMAMKMQYLEEDNEKLKGADYKNDTKKNTR